MEVCALLLGGAVEIAGVLAGAGDSDGLRIDAKFDVGDEGLAEQGVDAEEQLAADGGELLLPRRVRDGNDERFAIEAEGNRILAQALARRAPPRDEGRRLDDLFRLARRAQQAGNRSQ